MKNEKSRDLDAQLSIHQLRVIDDRVHRASPGSALGDLEQLIAGCSVTAGAGIRTSTSSPRTRLHAARPCRMLPAPPLPRAAGTAGRQWNPQRCGRSCRYRQRLRGRSPRRHLDSVIEPPSVPMSGGGDGDDGGAAREPLAVETALWRRGVTTTTTTPPQPTNANKQTAATSPVRATALTTLRPSRPADSPVSGSDA